MTWVTGFLTYLNKQNKSILWTGIILLTFLIGGIDYLTGFEISFSFFYILPVVLASMGFGKASGRWVAVLSAVVWQGSNILAGEQFSNPLIIPWNAASRLGFFLIVCETIDIFKRLESELQVSRTDYLTGILNRRAFFEAAARELNRLERNSGPLTIIYLDLDGFKEINDTLGHDFGDVVLKDISKVLSWQLRGGDIAARLGGDEFAILLPDTDKKAARGVIRRLKKDLLKEMRNMKPPITFSTGVLTCTTAPPSPDDMLRLVDHLMYDSKKKKDAVHEAVYSS